MYNNYQDEFIEEVRSANDIVDVIGGYIKLEKKGKNYFGLCPFHKEKTPSFSVEPTKQIFHCFGCGKGGNVIHFIMNAENLDFINAVKFLADRAKIQLPEMENKEEAERARLKKELIRLNTEAARFFYSQLCSNAGLKAREYLEGRALSGQTLRRFGIGYSLEEWDSLYKFLKKEGFDEKLLQKSGLALPGRNGGLYDRFRGRIMFPIFDVRGNIIGFGGRVLDSSMPKYLNSPETPVYSKGKNLYALNFAKNSGEKRIIVVEGYMDAISLHQNGITNAVASLGTALTESQGRILKKYAEEVIISYDADTAGQAATMKGLDILSGIGCSVKVLVIPHGKDPDEFIRKNGAERFRELMDRALPLIEYKVKVFKNQVDLNSTEGKISFIKKLSDLLSKLDSRVETEMYVKKMALEYGITEESIYSEIYKKNKPQTSFRNIMNPGAERTSGGNAARARQGESVHDERMLISLLCIDNSVFKLIKGRIGEEHFTNEEDRDIFKTVCTRIEIGNGMVAGELLNMTNGNTAEEYSKIIQKECNCEDNNKAVMDIIKKMELRRLEGRRREILELLNRRENLDEGDVEKLTLELNSIAMKRKNI